MTYKITKGPKGRSLYFKDGKLISVKSIPEDILATLPTLDPGSPERKCIFCGQPGTEQKLINGENIDLCLEHYQNKTTGEVVQQLRQGMDIQSQAPNTVSQENLNEN